MHPISTVSLNGVAIDHDQVKRAVACVQDFVRHPLFTQRSFFSEFGISMLNTAVTAADTVQNNARFDPWGPLGVEDGAVIADLKSCREKIVSRRKVVKDTPERWFTGALIPLMEYDVVFPSIFENSFTLVFKTADSSFNAPWFAFCLDCFFRSMVCSSDSSLLSVCLCEE